MTGTIVVSQSEDEFRQIESRRQVQHSTGGGRKLQMNQYQRNASQNNFSNILDESGDDEEAIQNIMIHLEEKQKRREQAKYGEDFETIKDRLTELLEDYQESDDEEMDLAKLTDPDFFISKETKEKNLAQSEINKLLDEYLEVCHDRTDILSNVYDNLNFEEIVRNLNSPVADDLDNVSSEISMTIEMIQQSSSKLSKLYNRLLGLCKERPSNPEAQSVAQSQLRRLDLQKQVINKFKTLHGQNASRKEKVDTWKYAANEIVDLLKSVRKEGANDFEQLEKEFEKLLSAFNQQTRLFEDQQDTISKQKALLKKNEGMKEKLKGDNQTLQDEYDRTRMLVKSVQMKCAKLEFELKEANEKMEQLKAVDDSCQENDKQSSSPSSSSLPSTPLGPQYEKMQNEIDRLENLLKAEEQKNKELTIEKRRLVRMCNTPTSNFSISAMEKASISSNTSTISSIGEAQLSDSPSYALRKKCIKCVSYKARVEELLKDLDDKREQIVQLSKHLEDEEQTNNSAKTESLKEIPIRYLNEDKPLPPNPTPSLTNVSSTDNPQERTSSGRRTSIVRSSTQQILVYQKVTLEKEEIEVSPTVWDQSTQTDFPVDIPVIMKQRASVPTQNVIGKNFSSLVDEEFKGMASRIYNYVSTISEIVQPPEDIPEQPSKENVAGSKSSDDHLTPSSSTVSNLDNSNDQNLPLPSIKQSIDLQLESVEATKDAQSLNMMMDRQQPQQTNEDQKNGEKSTDRMNDENVSQESVQAITSEPDSQSSSTDAETIKRRGNESGFFDDSTPKTTSSKSEKANNNKKTKWDSVRSGVINHVLRFINTTAKCRCSFLDKAISDFEPNNLQHQTDEDIIKSELNVFAEHAIDMLDVISYSVKQMNEMHLVPMNYHNFPVLTKFGDDWKPPKRPRLEKNARNVTFTDANANKTAANKTDILLPEIVKQPAVSSPKPKQQNKSELTAKEVKAKVAEKKRVKILERHKKLVAKLRTSGVGLKEIYTILGIQSA